MSIIILSALIFCAVFADFLSPHPYSEQNLNATLEPPSIEYPLGTDYLGRCILSRMLQGSRTIVYIIFGVTVIAASFGVSSGLVSGYYGGVLDGLLERINDILLAFPPVLLALAVLAALGTGLGNAIVAVAISQIGPYSRFVRGLVIGQKELPYIENVRALGARDRRIILSHILPNISYPVLVHMTLSTATAILSVAALSFIGLGEQPPTPSWGLMLYEGRVFLRSNPLMVILPGLAIFLVVFSLNALGESLGSRPNAYN